MATITQRIALTGDADIKAAFDALGAAGQAAFQKIQQAADAAKSIQSIAPTLDDLKTRITAVGDASRNFGENFSNLGGKLETFAKSMALIGTAIGGTIVGFGLMVKSAADAAEQIQDMAEAAGTTADKLQGLQFAAAAVGVSSDALSTGLRGLNRAMGEQQTSALKTQQQLKTLWNEFSAGKLTLAQWNDQQLRVKQAAAQNISVFSQLGVATHDADGSLRDTTAVLDDIADAFAAMPDGAQKSSLAMQAMGRSGQNLIPLLNQGSQGIKDFIAQSNLVAPPISKAQIAIGRDLASAFSILGLAADRAKESVLLAFAPATSALVKGLTTFVAANRDAWEALAEQIAAKVMPLINQFIAQLQTISTRANGNFISGLIDSFIQFGKDAVAAISLVVDAWNGLVAILQKVADFINSVFGTDLTGQTIAIAVAIGVVTGAFSAIAAVVSTVASGIAVLAAAFGGANIAIGAVGVAIGVLIAKLPGVQDAFNALVDGFNGTVQNFKNLFATIGQAWSDVWNGIVSFTEDIVGRVQSVLQPVIDLVKSLAAGIAGLTGGGGSSNVVSSTPGFASGGMVRGPGSGTSDSIAAWLSNGEYVIPKKVVDFFGVGFFDALRGIGSQFRAASFGNFARAFDMSGYAMPGFATGGLVTAVAGIGSGSGLRPVHINIPTLGTFGPMFGADDVINALAQTSVRAQMRSTGRKPGWMR